jgi:sulfatase maturation enzyme AslB (radical SAM superfamily)
VNLLELTRLGTHHVRNAVAEEVYLRTGHDATIPVSIYGEVIERCNYKCRYCDYWRRPNYRDEMSIEEWQKALLDLKEFIGHYHIEFSGGEPYIKKGFVDLITFCGEQGRYPRRHPRADPRQGQARRRLSDHHQGRGA